MYLCATQRTNSFRQLLNLNAKILIRRYRIQ